MTISSTTVRNSYSGDGSTTTFTYTFKIFQDSDIQVIIRAANGTETIKTITTHYTVTGAGVSAGGTVIFTGGNIPTNTQTVVLRRNIPQTQAIDYIANDPFPAESHEEGLDRATMAIQQIQEEVTRSLKLSKTNTMTSTEFTVGAADRANKILAFDASGEISVTQELGTYRGNWASGTSYNARDLVKDTSTANIFIVNTSHTSVGAEPLTTNAESAKYTLIVDNASASANANAAANHASNSSNFANNSSNSASNASNSASNASNHSANSSNFANNSSNHASNSLNSANSSANSAANSSNFANNSSNSANSASNHSSNSSNFANNSSNSANTSANHSANSSNFANNSSNSANTSANHSANSSNFANNSSNSANTSANHASNSSNHASNSSNHSANSSNFANNSSNHASNSSNFANNSSNFANTASNSANAANSARDAALAAADNFDDVYLGSKTTDPTLDNDGDALTAGDLYYNSVGTVLKYYTGSAWVSITSGGITDLVQDTTPQLGGNLDVNGNSIVSTSNANITLAPNGTGDVVLSADTVKIGDANADATITTDGTGDLILNTNSGTNSGSITIADGANGNITIAGNGTSQIVVNAGAVGTPTIAPTGDLNTGIFFPSADTIAFTEGGAEAMRIDSDGDVGIGETSPNTKLQVSLGSSGSGPVNALRLHNVGTTVGDGAKLLFTAGASTDGAGISGRGQALNSADLLFFAGGNTERMRITSAGTVGIGTTSPSYFFTVENDKTIARFIATNSTVGDVVVVLVANVHANNATSSDYYFVGGINGGSDKIYILGNGDLKNVNNSYGALSDIKIKQDIIDASSQWNDIKNVKVRKFRYKNDPTGFLHIGVVAQELEQVSPNLIDEHQDSEKVIVPVLDDNGNPVLNEDGTPQVKEERIELDTTTKSVKYSILYMKAIKALQEAMERIETLEAKVTTLENK